MCLLIGIGSQVSDMAHGPLVCVVPVRKEDHELLGSKWQGFFYYDKCLPMGCASS